MRYSMQLGACGQFVQGCPEADSLSVDHRDVGITNEDLVVYGQLRVVVVEPEVEMPIVSGAIDCCEEAVQISGSSPRREQDA